MSRSGQEEALECCYGANTVSHMMYGKAVAHAIRGHFLVESALMILLMQSLLNPNDASFSSDNLSDDDMSNLPTLYRLVSSGEWTEEDFLDSVRLQKLYDILKSSKLALSSESRAPKLWLLYIDYVHVTKMFLRAERTSDWLLHLTADSCWLHAELGHYRASSLC